MFVCFVCFFPVACSILCLPVGGVFDAQQGGQSSVRPWRDQLGGNQIGNEAVTEQPKSCCFFQHLGGTFDDLTLQTLLEGAGVKFPYFMGVGMGGDPEVIRFGTTG